MKFKYWKKSGDELRQAQISLIARIHDLAASQGMPKQPVRNYQFSDPAIRTLYEVLVYKLDSRTDAYRERDDLLFHQEKPSAWVRGWKTFWKRKRETIDWTRRRWGTPTGYYHWRKNQYKNRYFDRPVNTRDYFGRLVRYKLDPYDFKKKRLYNWDTGIYE